MLVHLLALLDLLAAGAMLAGHYQLVHLLLLYAAVYLIGKLLFWRDVFSIIDAAAGIYCIFLLFGSGGAFTWVFLVWFLYKTAVWFFFSFSS